MLMQVGKQFDLSQENKQLRKVVRQSVAWIDYLQQERKRCGERIEKLEAQMTELTQHKEIMSKTGSLLS